MHPPAGEPLRPHPDDDAGGEVRSTPPRPPVTDPGVLGALLDRHGWRRRAGAAGRYDRWTPPPGSPAGTSLLVPLRRDFPDSDDLLGEALLALSRSTAPSARAVLVALAVPSDEVCWSRRTTDTAESAPWSCQEQLRGAARQMLLAGSLAMLARAGYYGARHRRQAAASLDALLVGPAAEGRRLTAYLPVESGRPLAVRLHHALCAAREAVDHRRATGGMDAFDSAVEAGVSHELTRAITALVRGSEGARVEFGWAPAAGPPAACPARPEPVEFSPEDLPALREASARYLRIEPSVPVRLTGTVLRLRRPGPSGPGTVRLRVITGAEVTHVRMTLDEQAYRIAGSAHLVGLPLRVEGRLRSRGGFRWLTDATGVTPVGAGSGERDRMLRALRKNLDVLEESSEPDAGHEEQP
ncbi:hypothetical protein DY218_07010 [Streptomyces triticagri]|uniref:Uncharacterized protein n=1 Tax=Streptomyces triticagri TaxID=2293568 RepID=A0A372MAK4_9ACTN|nr:hypothetical protein [Streptomyces triticagri]RFU87433.1 hypothetical protein DY218_07010 [Streptomyces triticagri]